MPNPEPSDNFDPVPGVKYEDEPAEQPQDPKEPEKAPEQTEAPKEPEKPVEAKTEDKVADPAEAPKADEGQPRDPEGKFTKKPKPIADLLSKNHDLKTENDQLKEQIKKLSEQPASVQADDKIKALAEKYGLDEEILADIVATARDGLNPELPKEVQELLEERKAEKEQQEELKAFNARVDSLAKTFPDEQFTDPKVREKLLALAYSTEKAPDGEPYFQKELSELYFGFIKPEIEPGKSSAESSQGGTQATEVIDFEEIYNRDDPKDIDNMDSATFEKYNAWVREHKEGKSPIQRIK
ncbi:MAG: hypothetical protein AB1757_06820 [Acidobacteriota bacterium]